MTAPIGTKAKNFVLTPHDLGRVEHCPASRVYVPLVKERPSFGQFWGIFIHKFLEQAHNDGRDSALRYIKRKYNRALAVCSRIDLAALPIGETEVAYIIDTTARTAEVGDYQQADPCDNFYARADIVYEEDGFPWIADYKSGDAIGVEPTNWQMITLCTGLWLTLGRPDRIGSAIIPIPSTGQIVYRKHIFESHVLSDHLEHLRRTHYEVLETRAELREEGIDPAFVPGPWCEHCDIRAQCEYAAPTLMQIKSSKKVVHTISTPEKPK